MKNRRPPFETIALVLQGGGALGAYQAGVYEGLDEAGIEPDWVAGVSIGAINAALVAGNARNERVAKLREFWTTVTEPARAPPAARWWADWLEQQGGDAGRTALGYLDATRVLLEGQRGFFVPRVPSPAFACNASAAALGHYDTAPLAATLERLVDFERLNDRRGMRLSMTAVAVADGNDETFDNQAGPWAGRIGAAHVMASGALPPGFGAVEIDGKAYWDGGLVSNTPLATVLDGEPRRDTLAFQVDLWSAKGPLPKNLLDVEERSKDIRYSSRTRAVTARLERERRLRHVLREVLQRVPPGKRGDAWCREASELASDKQFNVVHLIYQEKAWDRHYKDYEFGAAAMRAHWASGLADIRRTLEHPDWLKPPEPARSSITHDVHRQSNPAKESS